MIDQTSEPGSWAKALRNSPTIKVQEFGAPDHVAALDAELTANLAKRKAIRTGYQLAQGRK